MTKQILDDFIYCDERFKLINVKEGALPNPFDLGFLTLRKLSTAVRRGYVCRYVWSEDKLILDSLQIATRDDVLTLNGVKPDYDDHYYQHRESIGGIEYSYKDLHLEIDFTGSLIIGHAFGYELEFEAGRLVAEKKLDSITIPYQHYLDPKNSERLENLLKKIRESPEQTSDETSQK